MDVITHDSGRGMFVGERLATRVGEIRQNAIGDPAAETATAIVTATTALAFARTAFVVCQLASWIENGIVRADRLLIKDKQDRQQK